MIKGLSREAKKQRSVPLLAHSPGRLGQWPSGFCFEKAVLYMGCSHRISDFMFLSMSEATSHAYKWMSAPPELGFAGISKKSPK